jgi:hypothetical protein
MVLQYSFLTNEESLYTRAQEASQQVSWRGKPKPSQEARQEARQVSLQTFASALASAVVEQAPTAIMDTARQGEWAVDFDARDIVKRWPLWLRWSWYLRWSKVYTLDSLFRPVVAGDISETPTWKLWWYSWTGRLAELTAPKPPPPKPEPKKCPCGRDRPEPPEPQKPRVVRMTPADQAIAKALGSFSVTWSSVAQRVRVSWAIGDTPWNRPSLQDWPPVLCG